MKNTDFDIMTHTIGIGCQDKSCGSYAECHVGTQFWNGWSDGVFGPDCKKWGTIIFDQDLMEGLDRNVVGSSSFSMEGS